MYPSEVRKPSTLRNAASLTNGSLAGRPRSSSLNCGTLVAPPGSSPRTKASMSTNSYRVIPPHAGDVAGGDWQHRRVIHRETVAASGSGWA
jgi:hypothetical protein